MDRPAEYKEEKLTQGITEDENNYFLASFLPSVIPRPISKERREPREKGAYTVGHRIPPSVAPGRLLHVEQRQGIAAAHRRSVVFPVAAWDLVWFQTVQGVTATPVPGPLPAARLAGALKMRGRCQVVGLGRCGVKSCEEEGVRFDLSLYDYLFLQVTQMTTQQVSRVFPLLIVLEC